MAGIEGDMIKVKISGLENFITEAELRTTRARAEQLRDAVAALPMSGWIDLPQSISPEALTRLHTAAEQICAQSQALVLVGVGGSSLGARALIDAFPSRAGISEVFYAGDNLSGMYMSRLIETLKTRDFSVIAVSKSGETTEPAAALRILLPLMRERYGESFRERLYIVAGDRKSPLRDCAELVGCELFTIPENIGGRYSVLTAAGLLPAAACGVDIAEIVRGAAEIAKGNLDASLSYAAARQVLSAKGFKVELFASFEPDFASLGEWWKQLFSESEGKLGRGILPAALSFSADLHSMGQYIQDGRRELFETIVSVENLPADVIIPENTVFNDGFAFLGNMPLNTANTVARQSVCEAHIAGGVPVMELIADSLDERSLGGLLYFFEYACAISALLDGVDPFDQPGVEAYKSIMRTKLKEV